MEIPKIVALEMTADAVEATVSYLADKLSAFVQKRERVMICFDDQPGSLGYVFRLAVERCGGEAVVWGPDRRWKTLLRQAFFCKAGTIIGPPFVILGLTKLSKATGTPLYLRDIVTAGYPCLDWMIEGIQNGLDCKTWGCFDWLCTGMILGFSEVGIPGVRLRGGSIGVKILDEEGKELPDGEFGRVVVYHTAQPDVYYPTMDYGLLKPEQGKNKLLQRIEPGCGMDRQLVQYTHELMGFSSVLDCRMTMGRCGLELEVIHFPGERLPKLPSCAKLVLRPWDPDRDEPFWVLPEWKNEAKSFDSH